MENRAAAAADAGVAPVVAKASVLLMPRRRSWFFGVVTSATVASCVYIRVYTTKARVYSLAFVRGHDRGEPSGPVGRQRERLKVRRSRELRIGRKRLSVRSRRGTQVHRVQTRAFLVVVASHLHLVHERRQLGVRPERALVEFAVRPDGSRELSFEHGSSHGVCVLELGHEGEARGFELVPGGR